MTDVQEDGTDLRLSWTSVTGETFNSVVTQDERSNCRMALIRRGDDDA